MDRPPVRPLRIWRMARGLTQDELAAKSHANRSSISGVESKKRKGLAVSQMLDVCRVLGVELEQVEEFALKLRTPGKGIAAQIYSPAAIPSDSEAGNSRLVAVS